MFRTLKSKISLIYICLVIVIALIGAISIFNLLKLSKSIDSLIYNNYKSIYDAYNMAQTLKNHSDSILKSMYILMIISGVGVIGGFVLSKFFVNKFFMPINFLTQTLKLVKGGALDQQIKVFSNDEIGELSLEFNKMTQRIKEYEKSHLGKIMLERNKTLAIVKSISNPILVLDNNYNIRLINNACESLFSILEKDSIDKNLLEVIRDPEFSGHIKNYQNSKTQERIVCIPIEIQNNYYNVNISNINDDKGKISGLVIALQNVTELKELEKMKTRFISTISHEFKTPLTSIMMGVSLLMKKDLGELNSDQRSIVITIRDDGERLSALVNDLIELSKIEYSKAVFKFQPCSFDIIVEKCLSDLYELAKKKDIYLHHELDENLPKVLVDYKKIIWVLNNLITNALKYTNSGDEICIGNYVKNGKMFVFVRDTGNGISKEYIDKIFDKFFQVKNYDLEIPGSGLGLSIAKEIVEAHNGEIWCESELDMGSTFTFTLLLAKEERN